MQRHQDFATSLLVLEYFWRSCVVLDAYFQLRNATGFSYLELVIMVDKMKMNYEGIELFHGYIQTILELKRVARLININYGNKVDATS